MYITFKIRKVQTIWLIIKHRLCGIIELFFNKVFLNITFPILFLDFDF